ncbi:MAG: hypothetical protein BWK73_48370 [Thiothrix lacustris]|uniref:Uncharacterized protein n=1 Tax=Thiothrix lacustris TaxID=525917 RepID=A0A1Y1Q9M5_9GAMM|nr:MAG: hypothetical protein BWK73_48370 [Thiothrix lacustris]
MNMKQQALAESIQAFLDEMSEGTFADYKIQLVQQLAETWGYNDMDDTHGLRENYSGQGMGGMTCYGIVTEDPEELIAAAQAVGLSHYKTDNMGFDTIVYFPTVRGAV